MRGRARVWTEVQYKKKNQRGGRRRNEVTFFVGNIPDGTTEEELRKEFQPFGEVSDVYVARKRDVGGNWFGFVRLVDVVDLNGVVAGMNLIKISGAKLVVSLAKYDKNNQKISWPAGEKVEQQRSPKPTLPSVNNNASSSRVQEGVSFREAVNNNSTVGRAPEGKYVTVEGNGSMYFQHCIGRSVIGLAKELSSLAKSRRMLDAGGYKEEAVSYVGGLGVMVTFRDHECAKKFVEGEKLSWSKVWTEAKIWNGEDVLFDRIVGLRITGVPLQLRDNTLFDKVGNLFGEIMWPSDFNWEGVDISAGSCYVLTKQRRRIDEEVMVSWQGREYRIWVSETVKDWAPSFFEEVPSEISQVDDPVEEKNGNLLEDEEMEEGEIRVRPTSEPSPVLNEDTLVHGNKIEKEMSPTEEACNNTEGGNLQSCSNNGSQFTCTHGEESNLGGPVHEEEPATLSLSQSNKQAIKIGGDILSLKDNMGQSCLEGSGLNNGGSGHIYFFGQSFRYASENETHAPNEVGSSQASNNGHIHFSGSTGESTGEVGQKSVTISRKRFRRLRSPSQD